LRNSVDSFKLALGESHAHIDHGDSFKFYADLLNYRPDKICSLVSTLPFGVQLSRGFYVRKGSPWREFLNVK
jgi:hypothetical protein